MSKNKAFAFGFAGIGLLFMIIGMAVSIGFQSYFNKFRENGIKTEGIISNIYHFGDSPTVFISFLTENGIEITTSINYYSSNMFVGKSIVLYYDPDNPHKATIDPIFFTLFFLLLFGGMGAIFFAIGAVLIKKHLALEKRKATLISSGYYIMADVIEVSRNIKISMNGRNPFVIHAHYSENGKNYFFKSHNILFNPSPFLDEKIRIYLDRNDYGIYYVDVDSLIQNE